MLGLVPQFCWMTLFLKIDILLATSTSNMFDGFFWNINVLLPFYLQYLGARNLGGHCPFVYVYRQRLAGIVRAERGYKSHLQCFCAS